MAENSSNISNPDWLHQEYLGCFFRGKRSLIFTSFFITCILLLLPLCIFVIYLGLKRWRQQRSTSAAAAATSHSDYFTYHMVAIELIGVTAYSLNCWGISRRIHKMILIGSTMWAFTGYGETFFHTLTCVERCLAVVHPVTYLSLRGEKGTRLRNISIGCVWLLCCVLTVAITVVRDHKLPTLCMTFISLIIISFCNLSVLCVLIRPGPGKQGGDRGRVDQSKRRAFYTMIVILGVLLLRSGGGVVLYVVPLSATASECDLSMAQLWFGLPSSLVLPLLFLQKAGTFTCFNNCRK